jgi:hypothetical protein
MIASTVLERGRAGLLALLVAVSLMLSALPAAAGPYAARGFDSGWDILDPNNITWERSAPKRDPLWDKVLRSITWE